MSEFSELDRLLSRYFDGSITAQELVALESRLLADEKFAEEASRWCLLHRQVSELLTETKLHALMDHFVKGSPAVPKDAVLHLASNGPRNGGSTPRKLAGVWMSARRLITWTALAATLCALVAAGFHFRAPRTSEVTPAPNTVAGDETTKPMVDAETAQKFVATLTQVDDCVWEPGAAELHHGQQLVKGDQIALRSGMVKVTFDCGAEVVLEGPCDFWLHSPMIGYLVRGKITANVPRRAFSFAILSPQVDFVDLGTSFGVNAGANGRTELHVFTGEVLCSRRNEDPAQRSDVVHVQANKAMEFGLRSEDPSHIAMDEQQFARLIALRRAAQVKSGHLVEDRLALWLAADVAVTTDADQRVVAWQDIVYGDNTSAEDAVQRDEKARPKLVANALNGQPAIRFDGESNYLLTTPLETTDDQTVVFVCQFSPNALGKDRRWGGQIINYDGPPSRYLSNTLEPGVLQIGEPLLENEFKPTMLTGQVFAGFIGSATVEAGRVDGTPVGADQPVIVSFTYDYEYENGRAALAINGRTCGEAKAFAPQGITSRKIIGRHAWMQNYFHGDLAELLIYNKALSPQELADTTAYLAEKYAIALEPKWDAAREVTQ